ncbi:MAG: MFS transporter, partial [Longimicrobiales bacterium]
YMDRVVIAAAAPMIQEEFGFDEITLGFVFGMFTLGYALFQVPGGWLADRFGPRRVLTAIITYWSLFTIATAGAWNSASLIVIRFLFGTGEAGAFPGATRAFSRWLPSTERGFAQGITHSGARAAGAFTPALVTLIMVAWGWRAAFVVFGVLGIVWGVVWYWYYRDRPEDHPKVNEAELAVIQGKNVDPSKARAGGHGHSHAAPAGGTKVPWSTLLKSSNMWTICLMYFCYVYTFWIFLSWMPTYLVESRGFSLLESGFFAGLPLLVGAITNTVGGVVSDRLIPRRGLRFARRATAITGFVAAVIFIVPGAITQSAFLAVACLTLAAAGLEFTTGVSWAVAIDVGHEYAGTVSAMMNMFGNLGGALSPVIFGMLVQWTGRWELPFLIAGVLCVIAALCWFRIDPERSVLIQ